MDKQTQDWYDALPPEKKAQYDKLLAQFKAEGGGDQRAADKAYLAVNKPATAQFSGAMANQASTAAQPALGAKSTPDEMAAADKAVSSLSAGFGKSTGVPQQTSGMSSPATYEPVQPGKPGTAEDWQKLQSEGLLSKPATDDTARYTAQDTGLPEPTQQGGGMQQFGQALGAAAQKVGNFAQDVAGIGQFTGAGMTENVGDARQQIAKQKGFNTWEEYLLSLPKGK